MLRGRVERFTEALKSGVEARPLSGQDLIAPEVTSWFLPATEAIMAAEQSSELVGGDASTELASNRTGLAFERTRLGLDRTLMAVVRTSLSLIGFGFTIYQVFSKASALIPKADQTARTLGLALLVLGLALLIMGLVSHSRSERDLDRREERLCAARLLPPAVRRRATPTYVTALALLIIGLLALGSVAFRLI
jgi:putative membrane protein